jgi:hypothetical protein
MRLYRQRKDGALGSRTVGLRLQTRQRLGRLGTHGDLVAPALQGIERLDEETERHPNSPATPIDEATQLSPGTLQNYFASHPPAEQRTQQVKQLMQSEHWPEPTLRPLLCRSLLPVPKKSGAPAQNPTNRKSTALCRSRKLKFTKL